MLETTVDELFVEFGSEVVELTVAVFVAAVEELKVAALTLMVITTSPPTLTVPRLQVTVPALCEQLPCVVETEVNVAWLGRGSLTLTF